MMNTLFLKKLVTRDRCFLFLLTPNRGPLRRRRSIRSSGTRAIGITSASPACHRRANLEPPREGAAFFGRCCFFCSLGETSLTGEWRPSICVQGRRIEVEAQRLQARSSPVHHLYCSSYHVYLHIAILQRKT